MSVGPEKILVILMVALLVFGPRRLPEVGRQVGAAVRELRKMQDAVRGELDMVLHPEHGTRSSHLASEPAEPGDHTAISSGDISSGDVTSVASPPDVVDDERRFLGPPGSFS